jgi:tripartite-type tricarboxylate transporter receptor subunit TctC
MRFRRHAWARSGPLLALALVLIGVAPARAENYPDHPIRIIVPFAAGGTVDIVARIVAVKLTEIVGTRVIVDNRGGAGGILGTEMTAHAPGDGYTLLLHSGSMAYDPTLHDKLPYDTMKDLTPVGMVGTTPNLLVVSPSFPAQSVKDLLAIGRERPGTVTFATGGFGSSSHLAVALFSYLSGVKFSHVPYKGAGPALADVVAGHVDFTVATMPGAIQHVRSGALRALGISSLARSPELPDVPTIAEAGLPGYEYVAWFGLFAPGTTPAPLVARINDLLRQALDAPDTHELLRLQGVTPELLSPEQFRDKVKAEIEHWSPVIEKSGMKGAL